MSIVGPTPESHPATQSPSLTGILREFVSALSRRSRSELGRAAQQSRQSMDMRQLRRDRDAMLAKLGREVLALVDGGEVDHPGLIRGAERVRGLDDRITALAEGTSDAPPDTDT
jgi:hypothetical protein